MNYIIDPKWVYWINVCESIKPFVYCVGGILALMSAIMWAIYAFWRVDDYCSRNDDDIKLNKKFIKWNIITTVSSILFFTIGIFIPSSDTLVMMKAAEIATYENVGLTVDKLKEITDYIIEAIKSIKGA